MERVRHRVRVCRARLMVRVRVRFRVRFGGRVRFRVTSFIEFQD